MARPLYETSQNLTEEQEVIEALCTRWKCKAYKMPLHYQFDYGLIRPSGLAILEIKCRGKQYETLILSLHKVEIMQRYATSFRLPAFLAVRWPTGIHWVQLTENLVARCKIAMGGRVDRGDPQDVEPVVHIPVSEFSEL